MSIIDCLKRASDLAGREIEVSETRDHQYVVLYMDFNNPPPEKGKTEIEALEKFIHMMEERRTHADRIGALSEEREDDEGPQGVGGDVDTGDRKSPV